MGNFTQDENIDVKIAVFEWILRQNIDFYKTSELSLFYQPILLNLLDKNKELRGLSEQLLAQTITISTINPFMQCLRDMKQAKSI